MLKFWKKLFHQHMWKRLKVDYRYDDIAVYRCQCRVCGKIEYIRFRGKDIV